MDIYGEFKQSYYDDMLSLSGDKPIALAAYVLWCYRVLRSCVLIVARLFYAEHGDAVYYTVKGIGRALRVYVFYRTRLCRLAARCILYR